MEDASVSDLKYRPITEDDANAAQTAWCDAPVRAGQVYSEGGDYRVVADRLIDDLYDYRDGTVFFKPTLAFGANACRSTKDGALSYVDASIPNFPEDTGFALKRWVKVRSTTMRQRTASSSMAISRSRWAAAISPTTRARKSWSTTR